MADPITEEKAAADAREDAFELAKQRALAAAEDHLDEELFWDNLAENLGGEVEGMRVLREFVSENTSINDTISIARQLRDAIEETVREMKENWAEENAHAFMYSDRGDLE